MTLHPGLPTAGGPVGSRMTAVSAASGVPGRRVVVLDDDPTGTQCAADVTVALDARRLSLQKFDDHALYVSTNARALTPDATRDLLAKVRQEFLARTDLAPVFVARGDSTLRGHIAVEMRALGLSQGAGLMVPAYPAAGRLTEGSVHWLVQDGRRVNMADTEFARDPVFGYCARSIPELLIDSRVSRQIVAISLAELAGGPSVITRALLNAPDGAVVVPDATDDGHLHTITAGLVAALEAGRHVVTRSAAPLAAAIAGRPGKLVPRGLVQSKKLLVVCGSHTAAASQQLQRLTGEHTPIRYVPSMTSVSQEQAGVMAGALTRDLEARGIAVLATERNRRPALNTLGDGERVMRNLTTVVALLAGTVDAVVTKGGITAAEVSTTGLGGTRALVRGQIGTGISLFDVTTPYGVITQAIVPGNIGAAEALVDACAFLRDGEQGVPA